MPPLTATPTNTRPRCTRGSVRGDAAGDPAPPGGNGLPLACNGDNRAMPRERGSVALPDDRNGDRGTATGLPAKDAPPGRLPAPDRCAGGSTEIPAQPTASAADATIAASNDRPTCTQSPDRDDVTDSRHAKSSDPPTRRESASCHRTWQSGPEEATTYAARTTTLRASTKKDSICRDDRRHTLRTWVRRTASSGSGR